MNNFRSFDQIRTNELSVIRHGWLNAWYELTDGQFTYGTLSFGFIRRRHGIIETANGTLKLDKEFFSRTLTISKPTGEVIGQVAQNFFGRNNQLQMNTGFAANFDRTGIFPTEFTWSDNTHGDLMRVIHRPFRFGRPFDITLNPTVKTPEIPLLIFLSVQILLFRQRRKAAVH